MNRYNDAISHNGHVETPLKNRGSRQLMKAARFSAVIVLIGLLTACAGTQVVHKYFAKGQVLGIEGDEIVLCIGSSDGAEKDQILNVYRYEYSGTVAEGGDVYDRKYVGQIKIDSIVNKHFARAKMIDGYIKKHDMAEFTRDF